MRPSCNVSIKGLQEVDNGEEGGVGREGGRAYRPELEAKKRDEERGAVPARDAVHQ